MNIVIGIVATWIVFAAIFIVLIREGTRGDSKEMDMKQIMSMTRRERKVFEACYNGWYLSGEYRAVFFGHERRFEADTLRQLYKDVSAWFDTHAENHGDDILLVKLDKAA